MIEVEDINFDELKTSRRLICEEAIRRGWKVRVYSVKNGLVQLEKPDGKIIEIFSATPPTTSFPAAVKANNKYITYLNFKDHQIPMPQTHLADSEEEAREIAEKMLETTKIVIKPIDAAHGHGVTTNISSAEMAKVAIDKAMEWSDSVLLQEFIEDYLDLRLTCINYKFAAGLIRVPARVKGDGVHTVRELIEIENENPLRGYDYEKPLNKINIESAYLFLGDQIDLIAPKDRYMTVMGTANVGSGGETIDITNDLPNWFMELTEKAAKAAGLAVCGVDFLVAKKPLPDSEPADLDPQLIEINVSPALFLHEQPTFGQARPVIKAYMDYLDSI